MRSVGAAITAALPLEQTKAVIALILFALNSSANAMTVIFKDYKAATAMKGLFIICISMVSEKELSNLMGYWKKRDSSRFSACTRSWR